MKNLKATVALYSALILGIAFLPKFCNSKVTSQNNSKPVVSSVQLEEQENLDEPIDCSSLESFEEPTYPLESEAKMVYHINGTKRGILLSDGSHPDDLEVSDYKVYLSDENGKRLSNNFDNIIKLSHYKYAYPEDENSDAPRKVKTDREYPYFVGTNLRRDSSGKLMSKCPNITVLDENGMELCSFNGYFLAMVGDKVVIEDYCEEKNCIADPDTYIWNLTANEQSPKHDYIIVFENYGEYHLIGVDVGEETLYTFYGYDGLKPIKTATESDARDWYMDNPKEIGSHSYNEEFYQNIYDNPGNEVKTYEKNRNMF